MAEGILDLLRRAGAAILPAFLCSTYLGGNSTDRGQGIAVDPVQAGIAYVTGDTSSTNLFTRNAFQLTPGDNSAFGRQSSYLEPKTWSLEVGP
jgi:hypothetical protein